MTGKVKTLTEKGFGFINIGQGKRDLVLPHAQNLQGVDYNELQVGDELEFETAEGAKGTYAVGIVRADP